MLPYTGNGTNCFTNSLHNDWPTVANLMAQATDVHAASLGS